MKRYMIFFFAALCSLMLVSCGEGEGSSSSEPSVPEESSSVSEPSDPSSASSSERSSEASASSEDTGEHEVTLCNGLGQAITGLRIRSGSGEEDYWSYEILSGTVWQDGTAVSLTLRDEEWVFSSAWEVEVTLTDGTVDTYPAVPLSDASMIELIPGGYNSAE